MRLRFVAGAIAACALVLAPNAMAAPEDSALLRQNLTIEGIAEHMEKLQTIANVHQGNRAAGTVGYEQSVSYTARRLDDALEPDGVGGLADADAVRLRAG